MVSLLTFYLIYFWQIFWHIFFFTYFCLVYFDKYLTYYLKFIWQKIWYFKDNIFCIFHLTFYIEYDLKYLLALYLESLISIWHIFCYILRQNSLDFILCIFPCSFWYSIWCIVENSLGVQQCASLQVEVERCVRG